jgi:hypothetical protein
MPISDIKKLEKTELRRSAQTAEDDIQKINRYIH